MMQTQFGERAVPASPVQTGQEVDAGIAMEDEQLNQFIEELQQVCRKTAITAAAVASIAQIEATQWVAKLEALFKKWGRRTEIISQVNSQIKEWFTQVNQVVESTKGRLQSMEADLVTFAGTDLIEVEDLLEAIVKVRKIVAQIDYCQANMEMKVGQTAVIAERIETAATKAEVEEVSVEAARETNEAILKTDRRLQAAVERLKQAYLEQKSTAVKVAEIARKESTKWVAQVKKILARAEEEPEIVSRMQVRVEKWLKQVSRAWMVESTSEQSYTTLSDMLTVARVQVIVQNTVEAIMETKKIFAQIETYQAEITAMKAARIAGQAEKTAQKREAAVILAKMVETEIEKKEETAKAAREEADIKTKAAAKAIAAVESGKFKEKAVEKAIAVEKARRMAKAKVVGVYVLVRDDGNTVGNIIVINNETNKIISTIPVGQHPCSVAVTPDGSKIYVANGGSDSNNIVVIDTATQQVKDTILVGKSPCDVAVISDGSKVHMANGGNSFVMIDTATQQVKDDAIPVRQSSPCGVAVTPDGSKVYVLNRSSDSNSIIVIDTVTQKVVATIPVKQCLCGVAIAPDGTQAYAWTRKQTYVWKGGDTSFILQECDDIIVIDIAMQKVTSAIPVGQHPQDMAITLDGSQAYVVNGNNANVSVIDIAAQKVSATISVGRYPTNVAVTPDGNWVYVVCEDGITVIDTGRKKVSDVIPLVRSSPPLYGYGIAITPDGSRAYVARKDCVVVINIATNRVLDIIQVNGIPNGIVIASVIPQMKQT
jgi:YVTN family beta-propeller protein